MECMKWTCTYPIRLSLCVQGDKKQEICVFSTIFMWLKKKKKFLHESLNKFGNCAVM